MYGDHKHNNCLQIPTKLIDGAIKQKVINQQGISIKDALIMSLNHRFKI